MKPSEKGQRIVWLVRILAAIGLTMVVVTTGLVGWTLNKVRKDRARALLVQEPLNRASDALRSAAVESETEIRKLLDENAVAQTRAVTRLTRLIQEQSRSSDPAVAQPIARLQAQAAHVNDISGRAQAWRTNYLVVWDDLRRQRTMNIARSLIGRFRQAIDNIDGCQRLDEAIKFKHWRDSTGDEAADQARAILIEQGRQQSHDSSDFNNQLAELARLVELLGGEEQFDSLADLKDNKLKPALDRLERSISLFDTNRDTSGALTAQALTNFKIVLFGEGFVTDEEHQNIQPGRGGLFTLRRDALQLRRERDQLKNELSLLFQEIEAANASFAQSAQVRSAALTQQMERSLAFGWRQIVVMGGGCAGLFCWLAWFISRGVKGQVNTLERARAEAELGRQTTQKLMLEQQAAAAELAAAHKSLQVSERRQELIFNSISEGINWIGRDGKIIFENPAAARLLGWEPSELIGQFAHEKTHFQHADGSTYPVCDCPIQKGLVTGTGHHANDEVFWRKNGTSFPVEYTSTPVRDEDGTIMGLVVVFSDISERKKAEAELGRVHKQLLETSRQAGMAEVATGVLHNVGNVLNSVNVACTVVANNVRMSRTSSLSKVVALLRQHDADIGAFMSTDPKGRQVPGYLAQLSEHLSAEQAAMLKELAQLQKNIEHIKDIVSMQQSYAKISGVTETIRPSELVEDAINMNASSLARHDVQTIREFADVPQITIEKQKTIQILVNLICNAKHACDESGRPDKRLTLRIFNGDGTVKIAVADNGIGISRENITRIFAHGFTTKKDGHGFGLHSGALAAKEMGGALTVHSEGPGTGAIFTLELPVSSIKPPLSQVRQLR